MIVYLLLLREKKIAPFQTVYKYIYNFFIEEESMNKELVQNMETEEEQKSYEEIPAKQIINTEAELSIDNKKNIKIEAEPSEDDIDSEELEHKIEQAEAMMKAQKEILETLLMIRQRKLAKKFNKKKEE